MLERPVAIVGCGLAGLALGRALKARGVAFIIYDRNSTIGRHRYSINLYPPALNTLIGLLGIDFNALKKAACVLPSQLKHTYATAQTNLRVNRAKLEALLREGLDVQSEHRLSSAQQVNNATKLTFENGATVHSSYIVAADGPLSQMRLSLVPNFQPEVLPYVVINGKRWLSERSTSLVLSHEQANSLLEYKAGNGENILLQTYVNEVEDDKASVSYTFSRPPRAGYDPLHKPARSASGATMIPEEFYTELDSLQLPEPFKTVFDPGEVRKGRNLHWLMRSGLIPFEDLQSVAGVVFTGEALRPLPILGSMGANLVILEAVELADHIAQGLAPSDFYSEERYRKWGQQVRDAEARLERMHSAEPNSLL